MTYRSVILIVAFAASSWVSTASPGATVSAKPTAVAIAKPDMSPASDPKLDMLYATGEGAMASTKEQPNRAKAYLAAKAYAKMQAIANLVQLGQGHDHRVYVPRSELRRRYIHKGADKRRSRQRAGCFGVEEIGRKGHYRGCNGAGSEAAAAEASPSPGRANRHR